MGLHQIPQRRPFLLSQRAGEVPTLDLDEREVRREASELDGAGHTVNRIKRVGAWC